MFIFDEVDKLPLGIFDGVCSMLNHNSNVNGVDYRDATFIFISNSFGKLLTYLHPQLSPNMYWYRF